MTKAYLKGYYGYKNFGDEMILFGIADFLVNHYKLHNLTVEVGDLKWIESWFKLNRRLNILSEDVQNALNPVPIQQHKQRRLTHLLNMLGLGKYSNYFTIFGGGEVLCDERSFPHDGRNYMLLHWKNIFKKNYALAGGISRITKPRTKLLYKMLIPRAQEIILRDKTSLKLVESLKSLKSVKSNKTGGLDDLMTGGLVLYEDFSLPVIQAIDNQYLQNTQPQKTILINISTWSYKPDMIRKIKLFADQYPDCKPIFFPCDINDDLPYYRILRDEIPGLQLYERTTHPLDETLQLFKTAQAGIGSRLHFLLLLKYFQKPFESIANTHKVEKLLQA